MALPLRRLGALAATSAAAAAGWNFFPTAEAEGRGAARPPSELGRAGERTYVSELEGSLESNPNAQLKLVQVVFRHGARTPLTENFWDRSTDTWDVCGKLYDAVPMLLMNATGGALPASAHDAKQMAIKLPGGCHKGELTLVGQRQALELGLWLRERYVDFEPFMPREYMEGVVQGRTTNFQRTKATIQGVLTGLYPNNTTPIKIATAHDVDEVLFANVKRCERLGDLMRYARRVLREQKVHSKITHDCEAEIREIMNVDKDAMINWTELHDVLTSKIFHGKPIPKALTREMLSEINYQATRRILSIVAPHWEEGVGEVIVQLSMGRLLQHLIENMNKAVEHKMDSTRMLLYSGHDTTLMPLLVSLGHKVSDWPPYASNVVMELWEVADEDDGSREHYVRLLYNRADLAMTGLEKGEFWSLDAFASHALGPFALTDEGHEAACAVAYDKTSTQAEALREAAGRDEEGGGDSVKA